MSFVFGMDSARSWFQKFQPRDKLRASSRKKDQFCDDNKEEPNAQADDEALSNVTKQKVAAAKQYIENHYKEQMKSLQERRERYAMSHCFLNIASLKIYIYIEMIAIYDYLLY